MSHTRYEWTLIDYALWTAGAIVVPIYETSSAEQAEWILANSEARAVIVGDRRVRGADRAARGTGCPRSSTCGARVRPAGS